jgi:hypothetical protein
MKNKKMIFFSLFIVALLSLAMCKPDGKKQEGNNGKEFIKTEQTDTLSQSSDTTKLAYVCPPCACSMDDSTFTAPGICPACGMVLVLKK